MELLYCYQEWTYRETFKISRGSKDNSPLFVAYIKDQGCIGRGECSPLAQYGHTPEDVAAAFEAVRPLVAEGISREQLPVLVANPAVRNALDCALWDLECKKTGASIWALTGCIEQPSLEVNMTISVNPLDKMVEDAVRETRKGYRILKLKADKSDVVAKVEAIAAATPGTSLIIDANEAWDIETLRAIDHRLYELGVKLIEQPLHHEADDALEDYRGPIPLCADESCRDLGDLDVLSRRYQAINIKLDKVGGLTSGLALARAARARGMGLMLGCSGPTSLGVAPAYVLATYADFVDLDAPPMMVDDRADAMTYRDGRLHCFTPRLWG